MGTWTYMASRLKPGKRTSSRYSLGFVSTAMYESCGGGACARKGSYGAVGPRSWLSGGGGGVSTVGGAGGGSGRSETDEDPSGDRGPDE